VFPTKLAGSSDDLTRLGPNPMVLTLVLDDGATLELAAPSDAQDVVGPFARLLL
jgi:hypothetical protein